MDERREEWMEWKVEVKDHMSSTDNEIKEILKLLNAYNLESLSNYRANRELLVKIEETVRSNHEFLRNHIEWERSEHDILFKKVDENRKKIEGWSKTGFISIFVTIITLVGVILRIANL